ncbi:hypothetical protein lerEdw1_004662 [Lerista edwardsae]|nr:hypothetical protein lerEdw1_004662 [Lerista edwardsae]
MGHEVMVEKWLLWLVCPSCLLFPVLICSAAFFEQQNKSGQPKDKTSLFLSHQHKDICQYPSEAFYRGKLKTCPGLVRRPSALYHKDRDCCPILFGHIEGRERSLMVSTEDGNENSRANLEEAEQVVRIAKQLTLDRTTRPEQIAVLTPYNAQVVEIKKLLHQQGLQAVTVCTIMKSQGSEWRYVIVSTVRSCPRSAIDRKPTKSWQKQHLGFVTDPNQINVGITRAQEGLCIIGNRYLLESNTLWRRLVEHYRKQKCYTDAPAIKIRKAPSIRRNPWQSFPSLLLNHFLPLVALEDGVAGENWQCASMKEKSCRLAPCGAALAFTQSDPR